MVPLKECPNCKTPTALETPVCGNCGRIFRTQFPQPASMPVEPTRIVSQVSRPLTVEPDMAAYRSENAVQFSVSQECARQFRQLTWYYALAIFLAPTVILALVMLFFLNSADSDIRTKIATCGIDVPSWVAPLMSQRVKILLLLFGIPLVLFVLLIITLVMIGHAVNATQP